MVQYLLDHGADPNGAMLHAIGGCPTLSAENRTKNLCLLIAAGGNIRIANENGWNLLHHVIRSREDTVYEMVAFLLDQGVDPDQPCNASIYKDDRRPHVDYDGKPGTPTELAIRNRPNDHKLIWMLLETKRKSGSLTDYMPPRSHWIF